MDKEDREVLTAYRLQQAKETIAEAELLIGHEKYRAAVNRIYYGMFYALSAIGSRYGFAASKHGQLIGWFNKIFVKTDIFDRKYGKMLREAFELRNQGDYDAFIEFSQDDVLKRLEDIYIYIADSDNHRIQKFDSKGNFITAWGSRGCDSGEFESPWGVVADKNNNIYVADSCNYRIQKFASDGVFIKKWSIFNISEGSTTIISGNSRGFTIDNHDNIYITDSQNTGIIYEEKSNRTGLPH